jgi:hypothetical protein
MICSTGHVLPSRASIARAVDALIDLLDELDGNSDLEAEVDAGADDYGEPLSDAFMDPWELNIIRRRTRVRRAA